MKFDCGCEVNPDNFDPDIEKLNLECPKVWDLISFGNVVGCFQIESRLGKQVCKKVQPSTINELADIITLMRPSCLEGKLEDGRSILDHYIDRKHKKEDAVAFHEALNPILGPTYHLMLFQEQAIKIGQDIAGMSLTEADSLLRAGIGKKKADLISKAKTRFLEGAKDKNIVNEKEAQEIFGWIEAGARYSFNASHAYSYAMTSYLTAYIKAHFPHKFYKSWLNHAHDKIKPLEELERLITDANQNNIDILVPDIRRANKDFIIDNNRLYYGIGHIKSVGDSACKKILDNIPAALDKMSWPEVLFCYLLKIQKSQAKVLISVGALDFLGNSRKKMLYQHEKCCSLNEKEVLYILENVELSRLDSGEGVVEAVRILTGAPTGKGCCMANSRRLVTVKNVYSGLLTPSISLKDTIEDLANWEESYLGKAITCSRFDAIQKMGHETNCLDAAKGSSQCTIIGQIKRVREFINKNGEEMAFCCISDNSGEIENVVIFADVWEKSNKLIQHLDILRIKGYRNPERDSFIVTKVSEI